MALKTQAKVNLGKETSLQLPTGRLEDQITAADLKANPERFVHQYAHLFDNAGELKHEASTRSSVRKALGSNTHVKRLKNPKTGISYNVFFGKAKSPKPKNTRSIAPKVDAKKEESRLLKAQAAQIAKMKAELEKLQS